MTDQRTLFDPGPADGALTDYVSRAEAARIANVTDRTVGKWLERGDLESEGVGYRGALLIDRERVIARAAQVQRTLDISDDHLRDLYVAQEMSIAEVAAAIGLSHTATLYRIRKAGIARREQRIRITPALERFLSKVQKHDQDCECCKGCWIWTGSKNRGYGSFFYGGKVRKAHRASYEMFIGPIRAGLTLDHLCRTRACVNPAHLEPVTRAENVYRAVHPHYCVNCLRAIS